MNKYQILAYALELQPYERKQLALALVASTLSPMSAVEALEMVIDEEEAA